MPWLSTGRRSDEHRLRAIVRAFLLPHPASRPFPRTSSDPSTLNDRFLPQQRFLTAWHCRIVLVKVCLGPEIPPPREPPPMFIMLLAVAVRCAHQRSHSYSSRRVAAPPIDCEGMAPVKSLQGTAPRSTKMPRRGRSSFCRRACLARTALLTLTAPGGATRPRTSQPDGFHWDETNEGDQSVAIALIVLGALGMRTAVSSTQGRSAKLGPIELR